MELLKSIVDSFQSRIEVLLGEQFPLKASDHVYYGIRDPIRGDHVVSNPQSYGEVAYSIEVVEDGPRIINPRIIVTDFVESMLGEGHLESLVMVGEETSHLLYIHDYVKRHKEVPDNVCVEMIGSIDTWISGQYFLNKNMLQWERIKMRYQDICFLGTKGEGSVDHILGHSLGLKAVLRMYEGRTKLDYRAKKRYRDFYRAGNEEQLSMLPQALPLMKV